jgi:bifunctional enzyme CysN/CysC
LNHSAETAGTLRFLAAGSVDDGKSTLIGRLLYNAHGVYDDQLESVQKASSRASHGLDLSLITDGLRAEREQGITIDIAYRYFSTPKRKFIIADAPGHEQYTRNMVTGASTADAAVLLVDARKGLLEQTCRHAYLIWLLGISQLVLAVNKMDLVAFDEKVFRAVLRQFRAFSGFMRNLHMRAVPLSALTGDNVTTASPNMAWYEGPPLLELLESLPTQEEELTLSNFRFPVQWIVRPSQDFRGYAGQVASGFVRVGQKVVALRSGHVTTVNRILLHDKELDQAFAGQSIVLCTSDYLDIGRGDMLAPPETTPTAAQHLIAHVIWMSEKPLRAQSRYLIKHTTNSVCGRVLGILHRLDLGTLQEVETDALMLNEIGTVEMQTHKPLFFDPYQLNRSTGSFIIIDPTDNTTAGACLITEPSNVVGTEGPYKASVSLPNNLRPGSQRGLTIWFTGLSGAGKTTLSSALCTEFLAHGYRVEVLDGDIIRTLFHSDLGFTRKDRDENVRRIGLLAELLVRNGAIVLVSCVSPYRAAREEVRTRIRDFVEVYVNAPLHICEQRDPKGLYKRARRGEITGFTGIDDPYESPLAPEVECLTDRESVRACTEKIMTAAFPLLRSLLEPGAVPGE